MLIIYIIFIPIHFIIPPIRINCSFLN